MEKAIIKFGEAYVELLRFYKNKHANLYEQKKLSKMIAAIEELTTELIHKE